MQIIITDVTESANGLIGVAGWNPEQATMVRLRTEGAEWNNAMLREHKIGGGQFLKVEGSGRSEASGTTDITVAAVSITVLDQKVTDWFAPPAPPLVTTLKAAFGTEISFNKTVRGLRQSTFIAEGAAADELAGIEIHTQMVRFVEESGKLKAVVQDDNDLYQLGVASLRLKSFARKSGLAALNAQFITPRRLHIRLGLAAPATDQNNKRYCQVNDIYG